MSDEPLSEKILNSKQIEKYVGTGVTFLPTKDVKEAVKKLMQLSIDHNSKVPPIEIERIFGEGLIYSPQTETTRTFEKPSDELAGVDNIQNSEDKKELTE